ncbi:macoilin isoform X2 [Neocloeon triangulifer]|uniref:macoilin isoform X2 n=1 Tax=Neocloeon triangulifer TaxID=2078957 RepID=UPI00286F8E30|nr:macoilin isoform X2 [Neocloeon triangulifer]
MKRRNAECGKLRRPLKRNKITEGMYGSTLLYVKFLALWLLVILADFILEFRFEFLWPFWLLLRSVYDSFKYQGLAFSAFFICIALTSDMICFFFIPVHWLFFAASTYVWVQYVWHTEKGICLPTIMLWLLFVYVEAAVRLRDVRHMPFHLDLCRPFAAHCIGYPVVTLGFGFKSYVGYRMRQRKQREVSKENDFYLQLLQQALPVELTPPTPPLETTCAEKSSKALENGSISNGSVHHHHSTPASQPSVAKSNHRKSLDKGASNGDEAKEKKHMNGSITGDIDYMEKPGSINDFDENEVDKDKSSKGSLKSNSAKWSQVKENSVNSQRERKNKANRESPSTEANPVPQKDENSIRLEAEIKRLKADLHSSKQSEQELKSQISNLISGEKSVKNTLSQLQADNDALQSKLHNLVTARQSDKQNVAQLERRLTDERRVRSNVESQLQNERKAAKKAEEAATARAIAMAAAAAAAKSECTESCRSRRRDLESDVKHLRRELKGKEDRCVSLEMELQMLRPYKESHSEIERLCQALTNLKDKNMLLENSLSAETRIKLDLFSALGEAKRQLEISSNLLRAKEKETEELKLKITQVIAVADSFSPAALEMVTMGNSSKLMLGDHIMSLQPSCNSNLDPNATAYTPKSGGITSTEA